MGTRRRLSPNIVRGDEPARAAPERTSIMVVDDCEGTRTLLAKLLGQRGYSITAAPDGVLAWKLLQRSPMFYGLVLTDFMMPRMNGIELLEKIRVAYPWMKVVLVTGCREEAITLRARRLGAFAVLPKPCSFEQLHGTIKCALLLSSMTERGGIDDVTENDRDLSELDCFQ